MIDLKKIQANMGNFRGDVLDAGRNVWLVGLGILATVEKLSREQIGILMEKGSATGDRFQKLAKDVSDRLPIPMDRVNDLVKQGPKLGLTRLGVPSKDEINTLIERVEQLTQKIDEMKNPV
jgi:polyhydroxyalkanoate synthesis regulator phasin